MSEEMSEGRLGTSSKRRWRIWSDGHGSCWYSQESGSGSNESNELVQDNPGDNLQEDSGTFKEHPVLLSSNVGNGACLHEVRGLNLGIVGSGGNFGKFRRGSSMWGNGAGLSNSDGRSGAGCNGDCWGQHVDSQGDGVVVVVVGVGRFFLQNSQAFASAMEAWNNVIDKISKFKLI